MQSFLGNAEFGQLNLEAHQLTQLLQRKCYMRTTSELPRKPWTENHLLSNKATGYTLKTNNQENVISSGDLDTGLFILSMTDTTCTLKPGHREDKVMQHKEHSSHTTH